MAHPMQAVPDGMCMRCVPVKSGHKGPGQLLGLYAWSSCARLACDFATTAGDLGQAGGVHHVHARHSSSFSLTSCRILHVQAHVHHELPEKAPLFEGFQCGPVPCQREATAPNKALLTLSLGESRLESVGNDWTSLPLLEEPDLRKARQ